MKCPYCNYEDTKVVDSRVTEDGNTVRRRRECEKCNARFSTQEQVEILNLTVVKKDGQKEEYKKEKIEEAVTRATNKRLDEEELSQLVSDIESEIRARGKCEIPSKDIGMIALKKLREKDEVSYLRFASVFKSFGSGERFVKEFSKLEEDEKKPTGN